eukprot:jgi/Antlo1/740/2149
MGSASASRLRYPPFLNNRLANWIQRTLKMGQALVKQPKFPFVRAYTAYFVSLTRGGYKTRVPRMIALCHCFL